MKLRLRMSGTRLAAVCISCACFDVLTGIYSLETGFSGNFPSMTLTILAMILAAFIIARLASGKTQIISETFMAAKGGTPEELCAVYLYLRKRERRMIAMLFLTYAVWFAAVAGALFLSDAAPISWIVGFTVVVPLLLLTSFVFFMAALSRRMTDTERSWFNVTGPESSFQEPKADYGSRRIISDCIWTRTVPIEQEIRPIIEKRQSLFWINCIISALAFFNLLFLTLMILLVAVVSGENRWMLILVLFFLQLVILTGVWMTRSFRNVIRINRMIRSKTYPFILDSVEYLEPLMGNIWEIRFEHSGGYPIQKALIEGKEKDLLYGKVLVIKVSQNSLPILFFPEGGDWK